MQKSRNVKPSPLPVVTGDFGTDLLLMEPFLRGYARKLTRSNITDDLIQETYCKALNSKSHFIPGTNLRAWLFTIMRNCFYDSCNASRRLVTSAIDGTIEFPVMPEQEWNLHHSQVDQAIGNLKPEFSAALTLICSGASYDEAAIALECNIGTVKSRVSRARQQLSKQFADLFDVTGNYTGLVNH